MADCTLYIDEAGDLGQHKGTRWFVLTGVLVNKADEPEIRKVLKGLKQRLNKNDIHFREIKNHDKRCYIADCLSQTSFEYINIIIDTNDIKLSPNDDTPTSILAYNFACKLLLERASWLLRDSNRTSDIVLSSRGTSRDNELISYISNKLIPYNFNEIANRFGKISAKTAPEWDMLQLADVCATSTFYYYEPNCYGYVTPCFSYPLAKHLYKYNGKFENYGIKFMTGKSPNIASMTICRKQK